MNSVERSPGGEQKLAKSVGREEETTWRKWREAQWINQWHRAPFVLMNELFSCSNFFNQPHGGRYILGEWFEFHIVAENQNPLGAMECYTWDIKECKLTNPILVHQKTALSVLGEPFCQFLQEPCSRVRHFRFIFLLPSAITMLPVYEKSGCCISSNVADEVVKLH